MRFIWLLVVLAGCGGGGSPRGPDAHHDAADDAADDAEVEPDAAEDASEDAGPDAMDDAAEDASEDGGTEDADVGEDATLPDAEVDAGEDAAEPPGVGAWRFLETEGAPRSRRLGSAVWTGERVFLWGGLRDGVGAIAEGALYDPDLDTWSPISTVGQPPAQWSSTAFMTTDGVLLFSGSGAGSNGYLYDPEGDTWSTLSTTGAPMGRVYGAAVYTGSELVVWGGCEDCEMLFGDGAIYTLATDTWRPTNTIGAPSARAHLGSVWTGDEMIVWGGEVGTARTYTRSGARYDPVGDTWTPTAISGAPSARSDAAVVWTGERMLVWGGAGSAAGLDVGGIYDPATDSWEAMSTVNQPPVRRFRHAATARSYAWTGDRLLVWDGDGTRSGGLYDPETDSWQRVVNDGAPVARDELTAVWTGEELVVLGGIDDEGANPNDYAAYTPP